MRIIPSDIDDKLRCNELVNHRPVLFYLSINVSRIRVISSHTLSSLINLFISQQTPEWDTFAVHIYTFIAHWDFGCRPTCATWRDPGLTPREALLMNRSRVTDIQSMLRVFSISRYGLLQGDSF